MLARRKNQRRVMMKNNPVIIILIICVFAFLFGCKSTHDLTKQEKILTYTCLIEHNRTNIGRTRTVLNNNVTNFLSGYTLGYTFKISNNGVTLNTDGEVSLVTKQASAELKEYNNKTYLIEKGTYKYIASLPGKYEQIVKVKGTEKGADFFKVYNNLLINAVKNKVSSNGKGVVFPQGKLNVAINNDGSVEVTEYFLIYIY